MEQAQQFALLPSYASAILLEDPNACVKLKLVGHRFSSIFIAPSFSRNAWANVRPFIAVDAAFTKTIFDYVLLLATTLDANNQSITLAWGIAPKENATHWRWFLNNLSNILEGLNRKGVVIMSDRQKGLTKAVAEELPLATEGYCCKHIERNLVTVFGQEVKQGYWRAVYARTEEKFREAMKKLEELNPRWVASLLSVTFKEKDG